jgi:hypothetical protein
VLLGHLDNGLGFYRFSYLGSRKEFVGVTRLTRTGSPAARRFLRDRGYDHDATS